MKYRVECEDRNTGKPYVVEFDARSAQAAVNLAMLSGHLPTRPIDAEPGGGPAPMPGTRPMAAPRPFAPADRRAMVALVIASIGCLAAVLPLLGLLLGVTALALAMAVRTPGAIRTAAIVMSAVALVLTVGFLLFWAILFMP